MLFWLTLKLSSCLQLGRHRNDVQSGLCILVPKAPFLLRSWSEQRYCGRIKQADDDGDLWNGSDLLLYSVICSCTWKSDQIHPLEWVTFSFQSFCCSFIMSRCKKYAESETNLSISNHSKPISVLLNCNHRKFPQLVLPSSEHYFPTFNWVKVYFYFFLLDSFL